MTDVFSPMSPAERERFDVAYLAYLHARDGVPDLGTQRLDVRERFFDRIDREPVALAGRTPVDQQLFDRNHDRRVPEAGLDEATLWALATAKANRGERYGVEYLLRHPRRSMTEASPHTYVLIEERYHTRMLQDALRAIGVEMSVSSPGLSTRVLVRAMVRLPEAVSGVLALCGEIVGVVVFALLLDKARQVFASIPPALARIEALFSQILVDEVGHVHFARSRLGPMQLLAARRLLPAVAEGVLRDLPEVERLYGRRLVFETVQAAEVDAAAARYPDCFVLPS
jgi:hypothetical protein